MEEGTNRLKNHFSVFAQRHGTLVLLILPALFLLLFLLFPVADLLSKCAYNQQGFTLEYFQRYFSKDLYIRVLLNTFLLCLIISALCLVMGYPVAYVINRAGKKMRLLIMSLVQIPFWTSLLVRTYAWTVMLQSQGVVNGVLMKTGLIQEPIQMYHNSAGVIIGMTHIMLPFMIFSLTAVMEQIDGNLITASKNLGAGNVHTFFRIFFPLSMPGVVSGFSLVFLNSIGYYIVPTLLGGEKDTMISQLIRIQISKTLDWNFAAAISVILIMATIMVMLVSQNFSKVRGSRK